jgi:hypothetical protein
MDIAAEPESVPLKLRKKGIDAGFSPSKVHTPGGNPENNRKHPQAQIQLRENMRPNTQK